LHDPQSKDAPPMAEYTIYHNPRCSKSRAALALLEERGVRPRVIEYLKAAPSAAELKEVLRRLGIAAEALVRKGEEVYKARYAGKDLTEAQWIQAMVDDPILIERPIVVQGERAVIGRPPEKILDLLDR
jgi:arsenate reductase (glutaredoxin)